MIDPRWRKVIRDLWDNKSRTGLVVLSISIGVLAFGGLFTARDVALADLDTQIDDSNNANIIMSIPAFEDDLVTWVSRQEHVRDVQGRALRSVSLLAEDNTYNLNLNAVDDYENLQINLIRSQEGTWPPGRGEILFERTTVPFAGVEIGQTIVIEQPPNPKQYELVFAGVIHDLNAPSADFQQLMTGYVSFDTLADLDFPRQYNRLDITIDESVASPEGLVEIADGLQSELQRRGMAVSSVQILEPGEHWANGVLDAMMTIMVGIGFFSLILSGFMVVNTISGLLVQQKRQIGMMKVVGATGGQVIAVYLIIVAVLGLLALLIALPASMVLAWGFLLITVEQMNFDILSFRLPLRVFVLEVAVAFLTPLLAALLPILSGTRLTAAEAISDHVTKIRNRWIDRLLSRMRGLSELVTLAVRNTFRRPTRLYMTMIMLTLAGTLFISVINVRTGLDIEIAQSQNMFDSDVQLILGGAYDRAGVERRAEAVSGVADAEGWAAARMQRVRPDGLTGGTFTVYGLPHDSLFVKPTMLGGRWLQAGDRYEVVVTNELLIDEPDIKVGDEITLQLNDEERDWQVVGIVESSQEAAYADYGTLTRVQGMAERTVMLLVRTEQSDAVFQNNVAEALEQHLDDRGIIVVSSLTKEYILTGLTEGFNVLVVILLGMATLVSVVGGLGLTGMMSLNVLERTREIGVLRSVGASNGPIRMMVLIEGMMVGVLSWAAALPISVPASRAFGNLLGPPLFGHPMPFIYTLIGPVVWLLIVVSVSATASLLPAQRASRISVREALAYE